MRPRRPFPHQDPSRFWPVLSTGSAADKTENVFSYWGVEDMDGEVARLVEHGATIDNDPVNVGGEIVVAELKDPGGNVLGLIYNPEFKLPD